MRIVEGATALDIGRRRGGCEQEHRCGCQVRHEWGSLGAVGFHRSILYGSTPLHWDISPQGRARQILMEPHGHMLIEVKRRPD
jgi:hypothetical protein